jgi:hypothetical protein
MRSNFDKTINSYKPRLCIKFESEPAEEVRDLSIADAWDRHTNYKCPQLVPSTIAKDYNQVASYIQKFATSRTSPLNEL